MSAQAVRVVSLTLKRVIDVLVALILLVLLAPFMAAVAVAIRVRMGRPVFFKQVRPGRDGKPFEILKFRTMVPARGDEVWFRDDGHRVTSLGGFLRRFSIDELPELVNVLRGDMSLVGPRPLLVDYLDKYTVTEARRHEMRPGITGLAQVNGRQNLLFSERLRLDVLYIDSWSLRLDTRILLRTAAAVIRQDGVVVDQDLDDVDDIGLAIDRDRRGGEG